MHSPNPTGEELERLRHEVVALRIENTELRRLLSRRTREAYDREQELREFLAQCARQGLTVYEMQAAVRQRWRGLPKTTRWRLRQKILTIGTTLEVRSKNPKTRPEDPREAN